MRELIVGPLAAGENANRAAVTRKASDQAPSIVMRIRESIMPDPVYAVQSSDEIPVREQPDTPRDWPLMDRVDPRNEQVSNLRHKGGRRGAES